MKKLHLLVGFMLFAGINTIAMDHKKIESILKKGKPRLASNPYDVYGNKSTTNWDAIYSYLDSHPQLANGFSRSHSGETLLIIAARNGDISAVRTLLDTYKVEPNKADKHGKTALMYACQNNDIGIAKVLLTGIETLRGPIVASRSQKDRSGKNAYDYATSAEMNRVLSGDLNVPDFSRMKNKDKYQADQDDSEENNG